MKKQNKTMEYTKFISIGSCKLQCNFTILLSLKSFAESIYNGSISLKATKIKQESIEDEINKLYYYN